VLAPAGDQESSETNAETPLPHEGSDGAPDEAVQGKADSGAASPTSVCQPQQPGQAHGSSSADSEPLPATDDGLQEPGVGVAKAAAEAAPALQTSTGDFVPADGFDGARPGYAFRLGDLGLGYYLDGTNGGAGSSGIPGSVDGSSARAASQPTLQQASEAAFAAVTQQARQEERQKQQKDPQQKRVTFADKEPLLPEDEPLPENEDKPGEEAEEAAGPYRGPPQEPLGAPLPSSRGPRHYWGQALQVSRARGACLSVAGLKAAVCD
jgi:hypothetical protein